MIVVSVLCIVVAIILGFLIYRVIDLANLPEYYTIAHYLYSIVLVIFLGVIEFLLLIVLLTLAILWLIKKKNAILEKNKMYPKSRTVIKKL